MAVKLADAVVYLKGDDKELKKDLDSAERQTKQWGGTLSGVLAGVGLGIANAVGGMISGAMSTITESISLASDLAETKSKVATLFTDQTEWITEWSESAATAIGLTQQQALDATATLGNMFLQMGEGGETAGDMGVGMVELAADLASFHNVAGGAQEVVDELGAAFRGEFDSIQKYIPMINAAAVEQQALADTGKDSAKELTALEKATATYKLLVEGAGAAVGDFARTSDGMANQQRILNALWTEAKTTIGDALLPVLTPLLQWTVDMAEQYLPALGDYIHNTAIPTIMEWADKFTQWYDDYGAPFVAKVKEVWGESVQAAKDALAETGEELDLSFEDFLRVSGEFGENWGHELVDRMLEGFDGSWDGFLEWWDGALREFFKAPDFSGFWDSPFWRLVQGLMGNPIANPNNPQYFPQANPLQPQGVGASSISVTVNAANDPHAVGAAARDAVLSALYANGAR